jgi:uncharacterized protein (DUF1330 family)
VSRSFLGFLLFCLLLVAATAGVVWYVGPTLAGVVADQTTRNNPYYLLQLLPGAAGNPDPQTPSYRSRFVSLAVEHDARLLWQDGPLEVAQGPVLMDVGTAQVLHFATGADLVQMMTSSAYRDLAADFAGVEIRHLGTAVGPSDLAPSRFTVTVLFRIDGDDAPAAPLGVAGERGWLGLLPRYQGVIGWEAPLDAIRGPWPWNRVMMLQFPDAAAATGWLQDPVTVTERAIATRAVGSMVVLMDQGQALTVGHSR